MNANRKRGTESLEVFMNGTHVGLLERQNTGALSFVYATSWLEQNHPLAISRQLPLTKKPFIGQIVRNYFDNLLPDDRLIREKIAARNSAPGVQAFDLLSTLGRDCVGALQFYPEGQYPGPLEAAEGKAISSSKVAEMIRNLRINPLGINIEQDFRISLAGVQSKTALLLKKGKWYLPKGSTPTTHILKPAIGKIPAGPDLSLSVENEWLCLRLLRAFELEVAEASIVDFSGVRVLAVKRFDREWSGEKLYRIPQEDVCQALGVGPEGKYESDGGPGIGKVLSLLNESDQRDQDRRNFMKAQLIYWLMAAIDGHAKNFSLFIRPRGFVMTPFYDVMSAEPHLSPKSLPREKIKVAMSVGKNHHYKINEILPRHWRQTASLAKFSGIEELISEVIETTPIAIKQVTQQLPKDFPVKVSEAVFQGISSRVKKLGNR